MDLIVKQLTKSFGAVQALQPLDLHIRSGEFTTLLGPSGCGKTTLLRMIAGLETPDSGEIWLDDECVFSSEKGVFKPVHKRKLGMVFQDFALWPHLTVYENVAFGLKATKQTNGMKERVMDAIGAVRLSGLEQRYPSQLSGGQQQRVAFARAIAVEPKLILFDEPLSALDALLRDEMRAELLHLVQSRGLTAIYVTHDQLEAMSMSDQILVMQGGKVLQKGAPEEIYHRPTEPFVAKFVGKSNWIDPDKQMIRPEKLRWRGRPGDLTWSAVVKRVSYLGDRYEIMLELEDGTVWAAYHDHRLQAGDRVLVYASPHDIHSIHPIKEEIYV
ncbi:ABC transporter ATP-binding protein [Brevibacillus panacihumi]|uniref:Carnitine transport ATP-binding protein OpuCA n=1 Tax=Brevibacillus panacihumi TaxID=497735 RepID=A0A3M8D5I6_9BACL|nr:ABC transporter ATP-binding protein [Brevibacillus panacihumi]RNB82851.1 ABC transporter ATP-binding protein [Brevibacillus panacihumi]